jgi:hypothetical protein
MGAIEAAGFKVTTKEVKRRSECTAGAVTDFMLLSLGSRMAFTEVRHQRGYAATFLTPKCNLEVDRG